MDKPTRILLLEDQFDDAKLIELELQRQGIDCHFRRVETREEFVGELKRSEEALRQSEERFHTFFECAPLGIALHDAKDRYIQTNRAYQEMLEFSQQELLRLNVHKLTHWEDAHQETEFFKKSRRTQLDHFRRETRYVHRDGAVVWAPAAAFAVRNSSGELQHIISMEISGMPGGGTRVTCRLAQVAPKKPKGGYD